MKVKQDGKDINVVYTYNSFKYMEELDFSEIEMLEKTPFKIVRIVEQLLMGGLNHNPRVVYEYETISDIVETEMNTGNIMEMLEGLMVELEKSNFFKNLQKEPK